MKITKSTFLGQNSGLEEGHGNVERVSQPCLNENYRKLSQLHACRTRLFLLLDANHHHPHWVVICPYKDATPCRKNFTLIRGSYLQEQLVKECQKEYLPSNSN